MTQKIIRQQTVDAALLRVKSIVARGPLDRQALADILQELKALAAQPELWLEADFPPPEEGVRHARYLIREEADKTFALYLNVMKPDNRILPHNHTTWATIAAVEGVEFNHLYTRTDDGSKPGYATLVHERTLEVGPGSGVALLPDDIHAVEIRGDAPIRHLHLYGRALETLTERLSFNLEDKSCSIMSIGVTTRREAAAT
ncbi:cysteine dioxygenase family protein [Uliginosibacterium gangwonense]|uniref:cysteine dioxygenase family protein n=1 Tax=Uliginosibacterium gangwonense TaxID=392736 RepID=UPI0003796BB8|nr:cysteine dioxygenase family protein [Uliginosibacterium gangwonense]